MESNESHSLRRTRAELTVSMPAFRAAPFIERAVTSVLEQEDVDLELVVVVDGSDAATARAVERCADSRVRVLRNPVRRGIGHCHNQVIEVSRSPFIAHVDADDFIMPGALRAMVDAAGHSGNVGQAFCDFFFVDAAGEVTDAARDRWLARLAQIRNRETDIRRALLVHGTVVNHLRTYPRSVFEAVGRFDDRLEYGIDYEMAVRVADKFDIVRVPRPLYAKRRHAGGVTEGMTRPALRFWRDRYRVCRRLQRAAGGQLLGRGPVRLHTLMALGLLHVLRSPLGHGVGGRAARERAGLA